MNLNIVAMKRVAGHASCGNVDPSLTHTHTHTHIHTLKV
jgi:hypothetical protein